MRKKCGYCLENPGRWDVKTQDYTADCFECLEAEKNLKKVRVDDDPCEICLIRPKKWLKTNKKALLCRACDKAIKLESKTLGKSKSNSSGLKEFKNCRICNMDFELYTKDEKECFSCKQKKPIIASNEKWLKRGPRKKPKKDCDAVAYSFFRKKYTVPNNVFRG